MIFEYSEEQLAFRQVCSRFFAEKSCSQEVRRVMETDQGYDSEVWRQMGRQLGLQGISIPEKFGGLGGTYVDVAVVLEEMGRTVLCAPYLATVALAVNVLLHAGDEKAMSDYLPGIASGEIIATATLPISGEIDRAKPNQIHAALVDGSFRLSGFEPLVLDAHVADLVIVLADAPGGLSFFAVEAGARGMSTRLLKSADQTRKLVRVELFDTPARLIGTEGGAEAILNPILDIVALCIAAEQVGGAIRCLDMAVEYAKERIQFGRAIGSFQAIKHMCADILLEVESAKSACYYAAWAAENESSELPIVASLAKAYCSDTFLLAARNNIQIHGGIGYTWEVDCHLLLKRAMSGEVMFGTPYHHRALVAERLEI